VAEHSADDREARPHVAGGKFDHSLTGTELAGSASVFDDPARRPVLLGKAGQQIVELREDAPVDFLDPRQPIERDQRRPLHRRDDGGEQMWEADAGLFM
jgi:hypothetical protein